MWTAPNMTTPCWLTEYSLGSHGYGQIGWTEQRKTYMTTAHRAAWVYYNGPIPDGMTVDHECHVRRCVRLEHLRLKTNVENAADSGQVKTRPLAGRPCRAGLHELTLDARGKAACIECANQRRRERRLIA